MPPQSCALRRHKPSDIRALPCRLETSDQSGACSRGIRNSLHSRPRNSFGLRTTTTRIDSALHHRFAQEKPQRIRAAPSSTTRTLGGSTVQVSTPMPKKAQPTVVPVFRRRCLHRRAIKTPPAVSSVSIPDYAAGRRSVSIFCAINQQRAIRKVNSATLTRRIADAQRILRQQPIIGQRVGGAADGQTVHRRAEGKKGQ